MKTVAAAILAAMFMCFTLPAAEASLTQASPPAVARCLPPGVSDADLASWPVVETHQVISQNEAGGTAPVTLRLYQRGSGVVMFAWVGDVAAFFDPDPDNADTPGLVNEQMFNSDRLLRLAPAGPCRWRLTGGGRSA